MLTIEQKEDSVEKLAAVAGKPTKNYLFAQEFNAVVEKCNELEENKADLVDGKVPAEQLPLVEPETDPVFQAWLATNPLPTDANVESEIFVGDFNTTTNLPLPTIVGDNLKDIAILRCNNGDALFNWDGTTWLFFSFRQALKNVTYSNGIATVVRTTTGSGGIADSSAYGDVSNVPITITVPALPAGATLIKTEVFVSAKANDPSYLSEFLIRITSPNATVDTDIQPSTLNNFGQINRVKIKDTTDNPVGNWLFEFRDDTPDNGVVDETDITIDVEVTYTSNLNFFNVDGVVNAQAFYVNGVPLQLPTPVIDTTPKVVVLAKKSEESPTVTISNTTRIILESIFVPAGSVSAGDILEISNRSYKTAGAGYVGIRYEINETNQLQGARQIGYYIHGDNTTVSSEGNWRTINCRANNTIEVIASAINTNSDHALVNGNSNTTHNIDYTQGFYILITAQLTAVSTATFRNSSYLLLKY